MMKNYHLQCGAESGAIRMIWLSTSKLPLRTADGTIIGLVVLIAATAVACWALLTLRDAGTDVVFAVIVGTGCAGLTAAIYTGRTVVAAAFILLPMTPFTVLVFSATMGAMWLATVPLTSGLVAHIYGLRYMGTLYGFVFLSHQIGGFLGVWLGGKMYDITGDYTLVWWIGVGVGAFSAIVHLPIREAPWAAKPQAA